MKNVYNHASGAEKGIDCALHQCVTIIPVPAWMLKLGTLHQTFTVYHPLVLKNLTENFLKVAIRINGSLILWSREERSFLNVCR